MCDVAFEAKDTSLFELAVRLMEAVPLGRGGLPGVAPAGLLLLTNDPDIADVAALCELEDKGEDAATDAEGLDACDFC